MHMQHAHAMDMDMNMRMQHAHVPLSRTWCHTATFCVLSREFADISAVDAAIAGGARTFAVLGIGSLLPALHAASRGANVAVVEACEPDDVNWTNVGVSDAYLYAQAVLSMALTGGVVLAGFLAVDYVSGENVVLGSFALAAINALMPTFLFVLALFERHRTRGQYEELCVLLLLPLCYRHSLASPPPRPGTCTSSSSPASSTRPSSSSSAPRSPRCSPRRP